MVDAVDDEIVDLALAGGGIRRKADGLLGGVSECRGQCSQSHPGSEAHTREDHAEKEDQLPEWVHGLKGGSDHGVILCGVFACKFAEKTQTQHIATTWYA